MNRYYSYPNISYWGDPTTQKRDFESGCIALAKDELWVGKNYDVQRMIHSVTGRDMMDAAELEKRFRDIRDPALGEFWSNMGIEYRVHEKNGLPWLSFAPKCANESSKSYPVILVFRPACVFAQSFYYHLNWIAAQGEAILLYFSTESVPENDLFTNILADAATMYNIDMTKVYATGHSHYGEFIMEFAARHPNLLAAVAQQCDSPGLSPAFASAELTQKLHEMDLPLIDVAGYAEMAQVFPVNANAPTPVDDRWKMILSEDREERIKAWQSRLYACRCNVATREQILAAAEGTLAERMLGFPVDHSETLHVDGLDYYIGDIKNVDGNTHLRMVCIENFPHSTCRFMHSLSWSFLRRFARCPETGKVIHLFE